MKFEIYFVRDSGLASPLMLEGAQVIRDFDGFIEFKMPYGWVTVQRREVQAMFRFDDEGQASVPVQS